MEASSNTDAQEEKRATKPKAQSEEIIMANRNGTGPDGKGPRTGRGLGGCKPVKGEKLSAPRRKPRRRP